ncbi:suppressor of fused domain protein [Aneurinibacillus aneurinilyticus]|jgi:ankyrin repeat protein|uniref:suppressor of fused domain protein n=1 Tax=Aneurinibacillus aneurinilyticus TaxID=1391 RepID=UPI003672176F
MSWSKVKRETFSAIERDDYNSVLKMIEEYPEVLTAYNIRGESLLHVAAQGENIELLKFLVQKGLDVNIRRKNDEERCVTPLHNAAEHGSIKTARWLLECGANIDAGYGLHATPLIEAAMEGKLDMVKLLHASGADINAFYYIGEDESMIRMNALRAAEMEGHKEVAEFLRHHGAVDLDLENELPKNVMSTRHDEIVQHIIKHIGPINNTISEIVPGSRVSVNIHIIPPANGRNWITLITSGMSDYAMDASEENEGFRYAELLLKLPANWPITKKDLEDENYYWPFRWLRQIAHIPHIYEGWLEEGVIIPNGEPPEPFAPLTCLSCIMIGRPKEKELQRCQSSDGTVINFYELIPIYEEERNFAINTSSEYLVEILNDRGIADVLDSNRENVGR